MKAALWALLGVFVGAVSSLLAGVYLDFIVRQVGPGSSLTDVLTAFVVHLDFARSEEWRGYYVDQERSGEWKIHEERVDLINFVHSNRVIGSASDPNNPPPWDITGYVKSDSKFLAFTGADLGAGFYLVRADSGGIASKPALTNTIFRGYLFGWNTNDKGEQKFRRCPVVLLRETDRQQFQISAGDVSGLLSPTICDDLTFPKLMPEKS
jgi:hypothetical protein